MRAAFVALVVLAATAAPAMADAASEAALLHDLGAAGCVIGADAGADGTGQQQGDWVVLGADICTIRLPDVTTTLSFDDPEMRGLFSTLEPAAPDDPYAAPPGCYFATEDMGMALSLGHGWGPQKAYQEMTRFIAAKIIAGDIVFYSDDILRTPPGLQRIDGECGKVPAIAKMRRDNALMLEHFGAILRAQGQAITCGERYFPDFTAAQEQMVELTGNSDTNAWLGIELLFLALGAGWIEGAGPRAKGTQRPPLCHYQ